MIVLGSLNSVSKVRYLRVMTQVLSHKSCGIVADGRAFGFAVVGIGLGRFASASEHPNRTLALTPIASLR
jgi:hypothetical protein